MAIALLAGCGAAPEPVREDATVRFLLTESATKSLVVNDSHISNCNILVYDMRGILVASSYRGDGPVATMNLTYRPGESYRFYCVCNIGDITSDSQIATETGLQNYQYTIADYHQIIDANGAVPMSGHTESMTITAGMTVYIDLTRCVALITIRIDDSNLHYSSININSVALKNVPERVGLYCSSAAESAGECSPQGDSASASQLADFNNGSPIGFYMFENDQGELLPYNTTCRGKVFPSGSIYEDLCSYVELQGSYDDPLSGNPRHGTFTYRFYLGGNETTDFSILRNHHYHIVVELYDDGVDEVSWRVDSDLIPYESARPIRIRPNYLYEDGWVLGTCSSVDDFAVTITYDNGTTRTLTGREALATIDNIDDDWDTEDGYLGAPNYHTVTELLLKYVDSNGNQVTFSSEGEIVRPDEIFTLTPPIHVAKKYGDASDRPVVIGDITCYQSQITDLSERLSFTTNCAQLEAYGGGFRLKGNVTLNGDLYYSITGSFMDDFDNPVSKTIDCITTVFQWCKRYYRIEINTNVREHIDPQDPSDNIIVTISLAKSWEADQRIARYYDPASYDEHGDLIPGYFEYTWYNRTMRVQMMDEAEYWYNFDNDGNNLLEGWCYDHGEYIYYEPLYN